MNSAFISYSHTDAAVADEIAASLDELGIKYFRDVKNIEIGDPISASVRQGLQDASAIVVIVSPGSLKSQWVAYEVGFGTGTHKRVLPYLTHPSLELPGFIADLMHARSTDQLRRYFVNNPDWHRPPTSMGEAQPSNSFPLRATENKIIIRPDERETIPTAGGIELPESALERICAGTVLAIGEDVRNVATGNHVVWNKYAGSRLEFDGDELLVVRESDIDIVYDNPQKAV